MNRKERRAAQKQGRAAAASGSANAVGVAERLAAAIQNHQAGRYEEAEGLYRLVLSMDPRNLKALEYLGILSHQTGRSDQAIDLMRRAVAANDRIPDSHYNLGVVLQATGRTDEAIRHYQRAVELRPDYAEAQMNLGNAFTDRGRWPDAVRCYQRVTALQPGHADVYCNLGNALARQGDADAAIAQFRQALKLKPQLAEAHNGLGIALLSQGHFDEAAAALNQALTINPNLVEAQMNLGNVAKAQDRPEAAIEHYRRALTLKPDYAEALNNLGNVLAQRGKIADAEREYRAALAHRPKFAEALNNLGILLLARGETADAGQRFQEALAYQPDFIDAGNNLARATLAAGDGNAALAILRRMLAIGETAETRALVAEALKAARSLADGSELRTLIVRALTEPWGRANDLAQAAGRLLKQDAYMRAWIAGSGSAVPAELFDDARLKVAGRDPLLKTMLTTARVGDPELERVMTLARRAMLDRAAPDGAAEAADGDVLAFAGALAQQCFINEYVFVATSDEQEKVASLRAAIAAEIAGGRPVAPLRLLTLAAYVPLNSIAGIERALERSWPQPVADVLQQQITEPRSEQALRDSIASLTPVSDDVSQKVQAQYEENPYPRWIKAAPVATALPFDDYLRRKFPAASFDKLGKTENLDVLIAGCGTGQHAVETAQRFLGAHVTAIDLSRTSLAYAKRKTQDLGLGNLDYAQADILGLADLDQRYDVIEASGVLHHMADPLAGWRALLSVLRPGGLMAVGLYSELARADVVATRAFIAERGYQPSADDIRRCRQDLLAEPDGSALHNVTTSGDFFSVSGCRDLLFHAQEHRLTIPQIKAFLETHQLRFLGFELDGALMNQYRARNSDDIAATDLDRWHAFEADHPAMFAGMYQFWIQKPRDPA